MDVPIFPLEVQDNGDYELRETQIPCNPFFVTEECCLRLENGYFVNAFSEKLMR